MLLHLLQLKKNFGTENLIKKITIMVVPIFDDREIYRLYYVNKELYIKQFQEFGVTLKYTTYIGENKYHSYDQWIQGMLHNMYSKDCQEYNLFVEDDYLPNYKYLDFDIVFKKKYIESFSDNVGYLATWWITFPNKNVFNNDILNSDSTKNYPGTSNGMISNKTISMHQDLQDELYKIDKFSQLAFGDVIVKKNIPRADMSDIMSMIYYNSICQIVDDRPDNGKPEYILSIQCFTKDEIIKFSPCKSMFTHFIVFKNKELYNSLKDKNFSCEEYIPKENEDEYTSHINIYKLLGKKYSEYYDTFCILNEHTTTKDFLYKEEYKEYLTKVGLIIVNLPASLIYQRGYKNCNDFDHTDLDTKYIMNYYMFNIVTLVKLLSNYEQYNCLSSLIQGIKINILKPETINSSTQLRVCFVK